MRDIFEIHNQSNAYNIRVLNRDLCGIILESSSVNVMKKNEEFGDALILLKSWLDDIIARYNPPLRDILSKESSELFEQYFSIKV
jgi:hypothetical protein